MAGTLIEFMRIEDEAQYLARLTARRQEFSDFKGAGGAYVRLVGCFDTREEVAQATDAELLSIRNLGKKTLAVIRQRIPRARVERCPCCGQPLRAPSSEER
jgi:hypothetical protein